MLTQLLDIRLEVDGINGLTSGSGEDISSSSISLQKELIKRRKKGLDPQLMERVKAADESALFKLAPTSTCSDLFFNCCDNQYRDHEVESNYQSNEIVG